MNLKVIEELRVESGLSRTALCEKLNKDNSWYTHLMKGNFRLNGEALVEFARVFNIPADLLAKKIFDVELE